MKKLFTIILTNYNNEKYIYEAIDSILEQSYDNIELIITDDCSKNFNKCLIEKYILNNKKNNLKVKFLVNNHNIGTVKTLNKALKMAQGEYVLFFASDDKLADKNIIYEYAKKLKKNNIVTSQWIICDNNLKLKKRYVKAFKNLILNFFPKKRLYNMCLSNQFGSGATAYKLSALKNFNYLDNNYLYLEDWPLWLRMLSNGEKIIFINKMGLYHRSGGISTDESNSYFYKKFCNEMILTFKNEVLKIYENFNVLEKYKILRSYKFHLENYKNIVNNEMDWNLYLSKMNERKILMYFYYIDQLTPKILNKINILFKYNKIVPITFIINLMLSLLFNYFFNEKLIRTLFEFILGYIIIYYFLSVFKSLKKKRK